MRLLPIGQLRSGMIMLCETYLQGEEIAHLARGNKLASPDLLLVLGTSLKVDGPKRLLRQFARSIHQQGGKVIYVNLSIGTTPSLRLGSRSGIEPTLRHECPGQVREFLGNYYNVSARATGRRRE